MNYIKSPINFLEIKKILEMDRDPKIKGISPAYPGLIFRNGMYEQSIRYDNLY